MKLFSIREMVTDEFIASAFDAKESIIDYLKHIMVSELFTEEGLAYTMTVREQPEIASTEFVIYSLIPTDETFRDIEDLLNDDDTDETLERLRAAVNTYKRLRRMNEDQG